MATLKQIADDLMITMSLNSDDSEVDIRSLYYWINLKRSVLIRQELEKNAFINPEFTQTIPCMELELADRNLSVCCNSLATSCLILKSKLSLPRTLPYKGRYGVISVDSPHILGKDIKLVTAKEFKTIGSGRHNSKDIFCTLIDKYLFIRSKSDVFQNIIGSTVRVKLVAEDPIELENYPNCNTDESDICFAEDKEYPIPSYMLNTLKQMVLKEDLNIVLSTPEDTNNNASSDQ